MPNDKAIVVLVPAISNLAAGVGVPIPILPLAFSNATEFPIVVALVNLTR